jgi:hypothetical protein
VHHVRRCNALVDPLNCGDDQLFPHHHPPDVGGVRLLPHRSQTFKLSSDPLVVDTVRDIVGRYLSPQPIPSSSASKKSLIQVLDREQPLLPMMAGDTRTSHAQLGVRHPQMLQAEFPQKDRCSSPATALVVLTMPDTASLMVAIRFSPAANGLTSPNFQEN